MGEQRRLNEGVWILKTKMKSRRTTVIQKDVTQTYFYFYSFQTHKLIGTEV